MPTVDLETLREHRPRLIARADQRHRAEGFSPRPELTPEALADDTLERAKKTLAGAAGPPPGGLDKWLDARLELLITDRWSKAVREYTDMMKARAWLLVAKWKMPESRATPEDVVNQAWQKARAHPFGGDTEEHYKNWLLDVTVSAAGEIARHHAAGKRNPAAEDRGPDPFDRAVKVLYQSTPSARVRREEFAAELLVAVERMPEPDRSVALGTLGGKTVKELADELGLTTQKVHAVLTRVLNAVRALLHPPAEGAK